MMVKYTYLRLSKGGFIMPKAVVLEKYCKSCRLCVDICPQKIMDISTKSNEKGYFVAACIDQEKCTGCTLCATVCPDVAIEVYK